MALSNLQKGNKMNWFQKIKEKQKKERNFHKKYHQDYVKPLKEIKYRKGEKFTILFSHDIDRIYPTIKYKIYFSLIKILKGKIKEGLNILTGKENPQWTFKKIRSLEEKYGVKSTWFIMTAKKDISEKWNPFGFRNYKRGDKKLVNELEALIKKGHEIGLHPGYYSFNNYKSMKDEKRALEKMIKTKITGVRNHYLMFDAEKTWKIQQKAGFLYDSTIGSSKLVGPLNGKYSSFWTSKYDDKTNILELPLHVMDTTIFFHQKKDLKTAMREIKRIIEEVKKSRGIIVINFHNTTFDENLYPGVTEFYEYILKLAKANNAWTPTMKEYYETERNKK